MGFVILGVVAVVAFVAGLLVGRRNPAIANTAATIANQAEDAAKSAVSKS
jgi:hypothetical protein